MSKILQNLKEARKLFVAEEKTSKEDLKNMLFELRDMTAIIWCSIIASQTGPTQTITRTAFLFFIRDLENMVNAVTETQQGAE